MGACGRGVLEDPSTPPLLQTPVLRGPRGVLGVPGGQGGQGGQEGPRGPRGPRGPKPIMIMRGFRESCPLWPLWPTWLTLASSAPLADHPGRHHGPRHDPWHRTYGVFGYTLAVLGLYLGCFKVLLGHIQPNSGYILGYSWAIFGLTLVPVRPKSWVPRGLGPGSGRPES